MVKDILASETAGSAYVPKKKAKSPSKKRPRAASQIDNDDATVRADSVVSFEDNSQAMETTIRDTEAKEDEGGLGQAMKLQNVHIGPNGTLRMNDKAEDHRPGDPLLMMVMPGGGKMGPVPDAESADELEEEKRKSTMKSAAGDS